MTATVPKPPQRNLTDDGERITLTVEQRHHRNAVHAAYMLALETIDREVPPMYYPALRTLYSEDTHRNGIICDLWDATPEQVTTYAMRRLLKTHARGPQS